MDKIPVTIVLVGCHSETFINLEVNEGGLSLLEEIAEKSKGESKCDCMPLVEIYQNNGEQTSKDVFLGGYRKGVIQCECLFMVR